MNLSLTEFYNMFLPNQNVTNIETNTVDNNNNIHNKECW